MIKLKQTTYSGVTCNKATTTFVNLKANDANSWDNTNVYWDDGRHYWDRATWTKEKQV